MNTTAFSVAGLALTWSGVISIIATTQLLAFAAWSGTSKSKFAKSGLRACDRALFVSGIVFLAAWAVAFDARAFVREAMAPTQAPGSVRAPPARSSVREARRRFSRGRLACSPHCFS